MNRSNLHRYTLHHELADCSLSDDFSDYSNKRTALRVARAIARDGTSFDSTSVVVVDSTHDITIGTFPYKAA